MASYETHDITCENCGKINSHEVCISVISDFDVEEKQDLLEGNLHEYGCTCEHITKLEVPLMYTDLERKFLIMKFPAEFCPEPENSKPISDFDDLRYVHTYSELIEKIYIFEDGLNDSSIEGMKAVFLFKSGDTIEKVLYTGKDINGNITFCYYKDGELLEGIMPKDAYLELDNKVPMPTAWEIVNIDYAIKFLNQN